MGLLSISLAVASILAIIVYFLIKRRNVKKSIVIVLAVIAIAMCSVFIWYLTPITAEIPENPAIQIRYSDTNYWIEDQEKIDAVTDLLETLELQREVSRYDGIFPRGQLVQADDYFIIEVYDLDQLEYSTPFRFGSYSFVISSPASSRFILPSTNNRNKYKILNAENILNELRAIISSAS